MVNSQNDAARVGFCECIRNDRSDEKELMEGRVKDLRSEVDCTRSKSKHSFRFKQGTKNRFYQHEIIWYSRYRLCGIVLSTYRRRAEILFSSWGETELHFLHPVVICWAIETSISANFKIQQPHTCVGVSEFSLLNFEKKNCYFVMFLVHLLSKSASSSIFSDL